MGCGASKEPQAAPPSAPANATPAPQQAAPKEAPPQSDPALSQTQQAQTQARSASAQAAAPTKPALSVSQAQARANSKDPDAHDPVPLMTRAPTLSWLIQLARDPQYKHLTPYQLRTQIARPATAARQCRYLDVAGSEAVSPSPPLYWVWVESHTQWQSHTQGQSHVESHTQGAQRTLREIVGIVEGHIKHMEPNTDPSRLGVWLDCICGYAHTSDTDHETALDAARDWLSDTRAKPTLMCMERRHTQTQNREMRPDALVDRSNGVLPSATGGLSTHGHVQGVEQGVSAVQDDTTGGGMAASDVQSAAQGLSTHVPVLILFRSREGLHGFQKAMFDAMHVTHLD